MSVSLVGSASPGASERPGVLPTLRGAHAPSRARLAGLVAVFVASYGLASATTDLFQTPEGVSVWFPPAALVVLFLAVVPPRVGIPTAIVTRVGWALLLSPGGPTPWFVVVNAVLVVTVYAVGAQVVVRTSDLRTRRPSTRTTTLFFAVLVGAAPLAGAVLTRANAVLVGTTTWTEALPAVREFWIGDAVAVATLVPAVWALSISRRAPARTRLRLVAALVVGAVVGWATTAVAFGGAAPLYLVLIPILAAAVRLEMPGATLAVVGAAAGMTWGLVVHDAATTTVASAHAFLVVAALAGAVVGSVEGRRRASRRALQTSEQHVREMVEAVRDHALFRLDPDGTVATWNEGARRLKGWEADEIVGRHLRELYPEQAREAGLPERLLAEARRDGVAHDEGWRIRRDGSRFWAQVSLARIDHDGQLVGFTKVTHDITAHKEADDRLAERTRQLAASNEELDRFASVASHDLQEPLRMITSYSQLLERRYGDHLDERGHELLDHVVDGSRRMRSLINDLLAYSRLQTRDEAFFEVDLRAVLDDVLETLGPELERTGGVVESSALPIVRGSRGRLHAVLLNVVQNAVKYAGTAPPRVRVVARRVDAGWEVAVEDDGVGIPEAHREEVFEPFRRLHTRDEVTGTGIGLAICRRVVQHHGGHVAAEGNARGGTTIRLWLPDEPPTGHDR